VTNTFVLPSWPGAWSDPYLAGARVNQWVWHRKHVTTVTSYSKCCEQSASPTKGNVEHCGASMSKQCTAALNCYILT